ncbi:hypothetical protein [Pseudoxanthomonas broegbernensis]|uniref:hypothetical protein n=1 Tax=Pseudoxanthomonas broegbernensis TaxID=83619 RepID=UPI0017DA4933|nr:hypothetical protein [Pseudoxanthomonas broegbernensis]MBB6064809.1 toxin CptA [Pseudoxanthomonas broegbernensis]
MAGLLVLSLLTPMAVLASDLPRAGAWPLALAACAHGLWQAWREARRAPRYLVLAVAAQGADTLDGRPLQACELAWRGPLAFVRAVDAQGRAQRLVWWPDTLPPALRRELRLAVRARAVSRGHRSMAP